MAKQLLVKTPQTTDGNTLLYDEDNKAVFKENIMGIGAKKHLESQNNKLPKHLKHIITEISDEAPAKKAPAKKKTSDETTDGNTQKED